MEIWARNGRPTITVSVLLSLNSYYMHIFIIIIIVWFVLLRSFSLPHPAEVSFSLFCAASIWHEPRDFLCDTSRGPFYCWMPFCALSLTRGVRMEFHRVLLLSSQLSLPLPPSLLIIYWVFHIKYIMHNRGYLLLINSHEHNVAVKLLGVRWRHTAAPF